MFLCFRSPRRLALGGVALLALYGAAQAAATVPPHSAELDAMIVREAKRHGVPERLVRRIVMRESRYNPRARNHKYWGLMQISYPTARSMGFKGSPEELLNPLVNLTYAVPYLANAFVIAGRREDAAVRLYASGYYTSAKSHGLLNALRTATSAPVAGFGGGEAPPRIVAAFNAPRTVQSEPETAPAVRERVAATALTDKNASDGVMMTVDKRGAARPPRKWLRDGGISVFSRGVQGLEQIAAHRAGDEPDTGRRSYAARRRHRKITTFAALEPTPANAQAYAAVAVSQQSPVASAPSQEAIAQATTAQRAANPPAGAGVPVAVAAADQTHQPEGHVERHSRRRTARRRHHGSSPTRMARSTDPSSRDGAKQLAATSTTDRAAD